MPKQNQSHRYCGAEMTFISIDLIINQLFFDFISLFQTHIHLINQSRIALRSFTATFGAVDSKLWPTSASIR